MSNSVMYFIQLVFFLGNELDIEDLLNVPQDLGPNIIVSLLVDEFSKVANSNLIKSWQRSVFLFLYIFYFIFVFIVVNSQMGFLLVLRKLDVTLRDTGGSKIEQC
eukprot:TRINITY_DN7246_c0_g2_i3.p4 TRINITY_DN7246_c0_g2~~TRINITY_DN7246_c0_g2_i3.p4  ORF type:complete len:105 (-),score=0.03 TRINITY_DN7246_c0_g2_i3:153-467(-)